MDKNLTSKTGHPIASLLGTGIGLMIGILIAIPAAVYGFWTGAKEINPLNSSSAKTEQAAPEACQTLEQTGGFAECADKFVTYFVGNDKRIVLGLYASQGVITRSVRTLRSGGGYKGRDYEHRDSLEAYTKAVAEKMDLPWTIDQAVDVTCREIDGCIVIETPMAVQDFQVPPVEVVILPVTVESSSSQPVAQVATLADSSVGKVLRAGTVKVSPKGKKPYITFEVVLRDSEFSEKRFSGVDLEEKVASGLFKCGDVIQIARGPKVEMKKEIDGKESVSHRNTFDVVVIQST